MTTRNELGDEMVEAYAGPNEGVQMIMASEWVRASTALRYAVQNKKRPLLTHFFSRKLVEYN